MLHFLNNKLTMKRLKMFFIFLFAMLLYGYGLQAQEEGTQLHITDGIDEGAVKEKIELNASRLLTAMSMGAIDGKLPDMTGVAISKEAVTTLQAMWKTSEMTCPVSDVQRKCYIRPQGGYQVRDIPITMLAAPDNDEEQKQDLVFNFTKDGAIEDIFVAVHAITSILEKSLSLQDFVRREKILGFIEQFRTAYNEKNITDIGKMYSDNALIITGKIIREKEQSDQVLKNNLTGERIEYVTQDKERYMRKLKACFAANKYINVGFSDIEIIRHPKDKNYYGVSLKQKWNSSNYNDIGYLFLLVDFKNEQEPMIHVRVWQPTKSNGELSREERYKVTSFQKLNY